MPLNINFPELAEARSPHLAPGWRLHEFKARQEFTQKYGIKFQYSGCVPGHQQMCVVLGL